MSNEPDDCLHGQRDWHPQSPDYDDSQQIALEKFLDDPDEVSILIAANADKLAEEFVLSGSLNDLIICLAIEKREADK